MAVSLAIIFMLGIIAHQLFTRLKLPGFLGILLLGMIIGPYGADWIDGTILMLSEDLRRIALIIILLRAGLGLNMMTLKMVGAPAVKLGFIPVILEGTAIMLAASYIFGISTIEAGMLGFIIAAVSPAVIVPKMLHYMEIGKGADKGIPAMILAGASLDDVVAITIFSAFAGYYTGAQVNVASQILLIPLSVLTGIAVGVITGLLLVLLFRKFSIRHTKKTLVLLATAIFITSLENILQDIIPLASLLGVMVTGFVILEKWPGLGMEISARLSKIWVFAEILLFFLVGAEVNYMLAGQAGLTGVAVIFGGLAVRSLGVLISLHKTGLTLKEKAFCITAYSPKATVQAAIGSVPLMLGVPAGELIMIMAVLSIIITAPLGSIAMSLSGKKYLAKNSPQ
ncbi:MAG: sodium:proton antiporter [Marinilabiliales bacterium]|nr:MAG: sodium:proton antiporter [Marinilabiliales bacterium]